VNDPLFVPRQLLNEQASKDYLANFYGAAAQKTFTGALEAFFANEFPQLAVLSARRAVVQHMVEMVHQFFPATAHLRQGQVITHDREGHHIDGESLDLALDALFQPRTAVLGGIATEERPPHTATDQAKGPRSGILDDKAAGSSHGIRAITDPYFLYAKISVLSGAGLV